MEVGGHPAVRTRKLKGPYLAEEMPPQRTVIHIKWSGAGPLRNPVDTASEILCLLR